MPKFTYSTNKNYNQHSSSHYSNESSYYFIHRETSINILSELINYAIVTTHYTLDTEDQLQSRRKLSKGTRIQIQFVCENHPSIIILIETLYLPDESSPIFEKIKKLCRTIFSNKHRIFAWGDVEQQLSKFYQYNLFNEDDI
ncbi:unnamed protein product [Rotaria sordida]|uniref:Uncharacterized protein n=1 Tax=Rotaria sordida TaxID=392033 RepID=A0A814VMN3_9BILA|nr:unnamed protein product [Rotaria sordida]CAF3751722.1 unnamed protein product [Rotaria sordida]CAF3985729.1 unnamed protein product [Rotaria sordida]